MGRGNQTLWSSPFTRCVEHKHHDPVQTSHTVIAEQYPADFRVSDEMYYPVKNDHNEHPQNRYAQMQRDH
ncbi:UDP-galactopyranose mutase [Planctomycetes bacterium CA13]|uniref:UDP-galactopyranose mutase n=1 Tax=Novipirellula herctigrandis TaxID=2527986 RepID=UPI0011B40493